MKECDPLATRRKNMSRETKNFLKDMLGIIEKHGLDFDIGNDIFSVFNLRKSYDDFIEVDWLEWQPFSPQYRSCNLSAAIKLMLGLPQEVIVPPSEIENWAKEVEKVREEAKKIKQEGEA